MRTKGDTYKVLSKVSGVQQVLSIYYYYVQCL